MKPYVIAIEEHYADPAVTARGDGAARGGAFAALGPRLNDLGELRLREMDSAGIDLQVISHAPSPIQQLDANESRALATATNDRLHDAVDRNPERFAGFAALPTPDPQAAADELERTVTRLGFKGAMIHGRTRDEFHDQKVLADLRARRAPRRADLYPPRPAASGHGRGVLRRLPRRFPEPELGRLGLHHRHRQSGRAHDPQRPVRRLPEPEDHHRPHGRVDPVPGRPHRRSAQPPGQPAHQLQSHVL